MAPETIIAMDGSWSQQRNTMHCDVDFVDTRTKKAIDFEIIEKQIGFIHRNYFGPSNGMEVEGVHRLIERWKVIPGFGEKVLGYVHDRGAKTCSVIKSIWGKPEFLDANHVLKGLYAKLDARPLLCGLKTKIPRWFIFRVRMEEIPDEKIRLCRNSVFHYHGIHTDCLPHRQDRESPPVRVPDDILAIIEAADTDQSSEGSRSRIKRRAKGRVTSRGRKTLDEAREIIKRNAEKTTCLEVFLQETEELLRLVLPGIDTQLCESLQARRAKRACKDISWKVSWRAWVAASILDINEPD
jgi:hypothetical protein